MSITPTAGKQRERSGLCVIAAPTSSRRCSRRGSPASRARVAPLDQPLGGAMNLEDVLLFSREPACARPRRIRRRRGGRLGHKRPSSSTPPADRELRRHRMLNPPYRKQRRTVPVRATPFLCVMKSAPACVLALIEDLSVTYSSDRSRLRTAQSVLLRVLSRSVDARRNRKARKRIECLGVRPLPPKAARRADPR